MMSDGRVRMNSVSGLLATSIARIAITTAAIIT